jgi:hypothetical protein
MKLFIKSIILTLCIVLGASCTLDLQEDPNAVQPDGTVPALLLNSMQRNVAVLFNGASTNGMLLTRLQNPGASTYGNVFNPQSFDGMWNTGYGGILQDAHALLEQTEELGYARHSGMARILSAYTLLCMVDYFGDVPYSEAFQGLDELNPTVDSMSDLYTEIIGMLDQGALDLTTPTVANGGYLNPTAPAPVDLYYANDYAKWRKFANSIKLKMFLNLRLTDKDRATAGINALLAPGGAGLISEPADNFVFRYGVNTTDPDARHPRFVATYPAGGGNYMSNWLMWHMFHGYATTSNNSPGDPRMRFYFYRQVNTNSTDPNQLRCVTASSVPSHYPLGSGGSVFYNPIAGKPPIGENVLDTSPAWGRTFCSPTDRGYWGRDHMNNEGTPPDAFNRTLWGAYPAGGRFDANNATGVSATVGMKGAGIQPIMMRSFVNFMLAEADLYLFANPVASRTHFEAGIRNSMADVRAWTVSGTYGNGAAAATEAAAVAGFYANIPTTVPTIPVRVATTAALTALSGTQTVDGIALVAGDRILVKNQPATHATQPTSAFNGIYEVAAGAWIRATDSNEPIELSGQEVIVTTGTANAGTRWVQATTGTIEMDKTAVIWTGNYFWDVENYVTLALNSYDAMGSNDTRMNYIAREYWISSFGNGVEAYNLYRRTGMPTGMQPALNPSPGIFPKSLWYPNVFASLNSTVDQKPDLSAAIFWDINTTNLSF